MDDRKLDKDERSVLVFALRYSIPRHTSAIYIVSEQIKKHIDSFEDWELKRIGEEIISHLSLEYQTGDPNKLMEFGKEIVNEHIKRCDI